MKKKINLIIVALIAFLTFSSRSYAANYYEISAPSSATIGSSYTVKVLYKGTDKAGSFQTQISIVNASCSLSSTHSSGVTNCNGGVCHSSFASADGIGSGTTLVTLSCKPQGSGSSTFKVSTVGDDSWNVDGDQAIKISSASKSVTINGTTTKKTTTTTKSTAPYRTTTKKSTSSKNTTKATTNRNTTNSTATKNNTTHSSTNSTNKAVIPPTTSSNTTLKIDLTEGITNRNNDDENNKDDEQYSTIADVPDNIRLTDLKIVGYDIKFSPNRINYTIEVDEDVTELYIIAEKENDSIIVDNVGVVNIDDEKEVIIRVASNISDDEIEYKLKIKTKSFEGVSLTVFLISIGIIILILIILRVLQEIKRIKKNQSLAKEIKPITFEEKDSKADEQLSIATSNNESVPIENINSSSSNIDDTMEIFDVKPIEMTSPPVSDSIPTQNISDFEKQKIDEADELWLAVETKTDTNDVLVEVSEVVPNTEANVDELFNNIDNYLEK